MRCPHCDELINDVLEVCPACTRMSHATSGDHARFSIDVPMLMTRSETAAITLAIALALCPVNAGADVLKLTPGIVKQVTALAVEARKAFPTSPQDAAAKFETEMSEAFGQLAVTVSINWA